MLDPFQNLGLRLASPFTGAVSAIAELLSGEDGPPQTELEARIEELLAEKASLQERAGQVAELEAMLGFTQANPQFQYEGASVIERRTGNFENLLAIDRGSDDGIKEGMVVLSPQGSLAGHIVRVFANYSWVRLIIDSNVAVQVEVPTADIDGVTASDGGRTLTLDLVLKNANVQVGDEVISSAGINFPEGLIVGLITNVDNSEELFLRVTIEPTAPLFGLDSVLVITNFEPDALEGPAE